MDNIQIGLPQPAQVQAIVSLLESDLMRAIFGPINVSKLLHESCMCLSAMDVASGACVGFLALTDAPVGEDAERRDYIASEARAIGLNPDVCVHSPVLACAEETPPALPKALLYEACMQLAHVQSVMLTTCADLGLAHASITNLFQKVAADKSKDMFMYECTRAAVLPKLKIRRARVEDHDELLPVLQAASTRLPALSQLPEWVDPSREYALARLIEAQDDDQVVLVGEADGAVQGMMVLSADITTAALDPHFDLMPYDCLIDADAFAARYEIAREAAAAELAARASPDVSPGASDSGIDDDDVGGMPQGTPDASLMDLGATVPPEGMEDLDEGLRPSPGSTPATGDRPPLGMTGEEASSGGADARGEGTGQAHVEGQEERVQITAYGASAEPAPKELPQPSEEDIRNAMKDLSEAGEFADAKSTAFAITMLCLREGFDCMGPQMLTAAFEALPDRDFCVLTLPHASPEPILLRDFNRIAPLPGQVAPEVLYILNRHALAEDFTVRLGAPEDTEGLGDLVDGMEGETDILTSFRSAMEAKSAVVAHVGGELVGVVTVLPSVDQGLLHAYFSLEDLMDEDQMSAQAYAEIDTFVINPIFAHRTRLLLSRCLSLIGKDCLLYALPPGQLAPDVVRDMYQVPPRRMVPKRPVGEEQPQYALFALAKPLAFRWRQAVNSQVVVVGASDCALATLERLLLSMDAALTGLLMVSPVGIAPGPPGSPFSTAGLARIGMQAQVAVLEGRMVGIDRDAHEIHLDTGVVVPYERLVLAAGLQDQTVADLGEEAATGTDYSVVTLDELVAGFTRGDADDMDVLTVYGDGLEALQALSILHRAGAADKTRFVAPPLDPEEEGYNVGTALTALAREAALQQGVQLPEPERMTLFEIQPGDATEGATKAACLFELMLMPDEEGGEEGGEGEGELVEEAITTDLLVTAAAPDVDRALFECVNESGLVYDGRLVVDGAFRTADANVYAGGSLCKFGRAVCADVLLEHYSSHEVGHRMAQALLCDVLGEESADDASAGAEAPMLLEPKIVTCELPGGLHFLFIAVATAIAAPDVARHPGWHLMETNTDRGFCRVMLDADDIVQGIVHCGKGGLNPYRMRDVIGMPISYLGGLRNDPEQEEIAGGPDLVMVLQSNWMEGLFHDRFLALREALVKQVAGALSLQEEGGDGGVSDDDARKALVSVLGVCDEKMYAFVEKYCHEMLMG